MAAESCSGASAEHPDFVLLGPVGFLGSAILRALQAGGYRVVTSRLRLCDRAGIEALLDAQRPVLGVICAAGERGKPNISWCDQHPVETVDANITGQLNVAAACHSRGLHVTLIGTGTLYDMDPSQPEQTFSEHDVPNISQPGVYVALRRTLEDLLRYFDNVLTLRVLFPVSYDLDARGLLGKLLRFERVDRAVTSVTVLDDLCPLIPELVKQRLVGPLNFANPGVVAYADVIEALASRAPDGCRLPQLSDAPPKRPAPRLAVERLCEAVSRRPPPASESVLRIVAALGPDDFAAVAAERPAKRKSPL